MLLLLMLVSGLVKMVLYDLVNGLNFLSDSVLMQWIVLVVNSVKFCFIALLKHCIIVKWKIFELACACAFDLAFIQGYVFDFTFLQDYVFDLAFLGGCSMVKWKRNCVIFLNLYAFLLFMVLFGVVIPREPLHANLQHCENP